MLKIDGVPMGINQNIYQNSTDNPSMIIPYGKTIFLKLSLSLFIYLL